MHPIQEDFPTMHYAKDHRTGYLFDPWVHLGPRRRQILDTGWPGLFRKNLLDRLPVGRLARKFKEFLGRHTKELFTILGGQILQQMFDLSDEEARNALLFRTDWQYALDITDSSDENLYVSERTWRSYRQLSITEGLDSMMFGMLTDVLIKAFGVDTTRQRLDSTHMLSNMRKLGRIRIFVATIQKFLRVLKRRYPTLIAALDTGFIERYLAKDVDACFSRVKPSESSRTLQEVAEDLASLVERFAGYEDIQTLPEYHLLERVLREQCEVTGSSAVAKVTVKPPREVSSDSLQNPSDPNAGYDAHKGSGYQAQLMETYQPQERKDQKIPNLITYFNVEGAHKQDTDALKPALENTARRDCCPTQVLCDTRYGSDENVQEAKDKGVTVIAPVAGKATTKSLTLGLFTSDPHTHFITGCPEGHSPEKVRRTKKNRLCATFNRETCQTCSRRTDCPVVMGKKAAALYYDAPMLRCAYRRNHEQTPEFKSRYRWRSGIEGTNSHLKQDTGASRLRVRGLPAMHFAGTLKALGVNIMRSACAMKARIAEGLTPLLGQNSPVTAVFSLLRSLSLEPLFQKMRKCHSLYKNTCFYLCA